MEFTKLDKEKFAAALRKEQDKLERYEKRQREAPRRNFMERAKRAGFSIPQARFMWDELAQVDHWHDDCIEDSFLEERSKSARLLDEDRRQRSMSRIRPDSV